ncbi:PHD zinc finger-containing protein [Tieghemostelium lacteum]|uniref:PHD zinc finger-containing protein n=1 Tax=Tieghemostelium lacteum TaxID=361077 RepID=A0A152AAG5_TIELA|nr:PHD zinc finger-containing protein [Tieghemostelium lacteum]|eukprot:KYR03121.1 PHD zinc finger-containing protein [Tieghemostelium lacteum]
MTSISNGTPQQVPQQLLGQDEVTQGTYLCSKCGQRKRGHTCTVQPTKSIEQLPLLQMYGTPGGYSVPMATRRTFNQTMQNQQAVLQQQQMSQNHTAYLNYQAFLQQQQHTSLVKPNQPLSEDQKREREKMASNYNMTLFLDKQERHPFYFDPHTKTIQVINSFEITVSDQWKNLSEAEKSDITKDIQVMVTQRHVLLENQQNIQEMSHFIDQNEQKKKREFERYQILSNHRMDLIKEAIEKIPKPKNNIASFFHYLNSRRDLEKKAKPESTLSDIAKLVASKWKQLSEEEKQPYNEKAREDRKRYEDEVRAYNQKIAQIREETPEVDYNHVIDENYPLPNKPSSVPTSTQSSFITSKFGSQVDKSTKCESCHQNDLLEEMIKCNACENHYHSSKCINLPPVTIDYLKSGDKRQKWCCENCKVCKVCHDNVNDDKITICDICDKAFHIYCLQPPLTKIPASGWRCTKCIFCIHCGSSTPGQNPTSKWKSNYTSCETCYNQFAEKKYCPVCRVILPKTTEKPTIQCIRCNRHVHINCDETQPTSNMTETYKCPQCRVVPQQKIVPKPLVTETELITQTPQKLTRRTAAINANNNLKRKRDEDDESESDLNIED